MVELTTPENIVVNQPIPVAFQSESRVAGRVRLTKGTEALPITVVREGKEPISGTGPRIRGKSGQFHITDWGEHEVGTELVLRFEAAKVWLTVVEPAPPGWDFSDRS